jgi:phosphoserine phosphatase
MRARALAVIATLLALGCGGPGATRPAGVTPAAAAAKASDPLPSWREGAAKRRVTDFVRRVTTPGSPGFVAPPERVAVFDNDGTLWVEQPLYAQLAFAIDRVRELAPEHPEWRREPWLRAAIEGDVEALSAGGQRAIVDLIMASHAGMTTEEFERIVDEWLAEARHPRFHRPYTELVYRPMLELMAYLKANEFQVYIVSGGGIDFMRAWVERVYHLPRSHVIGSSIDTEFTERHGEPVLIRRAKVDFIDDGPGKPVAIHRFIGRRPIAAFGNSDGDLQMLEWTAAGPGETLALIVHHTDAEREWAYDRGSKIGELDEALDQARARGFTVVDMKRDWKAVFGFDARELGRTWTRSASGGASGATSRARAGSG